MKTRNEIRWTIDIGWLLLVWFLSGFWSISASKQQGATFDEPLYLEQGLEAWHTGKFSELLRVGTMPLPMHVQTLPIYLWEKKTGITADLHDDFSGWLRIARNSNQVFWGLLLLYTWLWGRKLAGSWGARLAVTVMALEPSLLSHAGLATTDIAISACLLAFGFHVFIGLDHPQLRFRILYPLLWFAAALCAKASALVFGPLIYLVLSIERAVRRGEIVPIYPEFRPLAEEGDEVKPSRWQAMKQAAAKLKPEDPTDPAHIMISKSQSGLRVAMAWVRGTFHFLWQKAWMKPAAWIFLTGFLLTLIYCGSDWKPEGSFSKWAYSLNPDRIGVTTVRWLADNVAIFHNAGTALVRQIMHNLQGHGVYYLGDVDTRSFRTYFPVLLTNKLPIPILLSPLLLLLFKRRALNQPVLWIALILFLFSFNTKVQIGIRMMFPLVVFLIVGICVAWVDVLSSLADSISRKLAAVTVGCGLVWLLTSLITIWPHGLNYANEFWGGPQRIHRFFSDSNLDWGQGLPELTKWSQEAKVKNLSLWYFGTDPMRDELPFHTFSIDPNDCADLREKLERLPGKYLAVSTTLVCGSYLHPNNKKAYCIEAVEMAELLRKHKPIARTTTFFVYDVNKLLESITSKPYDEAPRPASFPTAALPQ